MALPGTGPQVPGSHWATEPVRPVISRTVCSRWDSSLVPRRASYTNKKSISTEKCYEPCHRSGPAGAKGAGFCAPPTTWSVKMAAAARCRRTLRNSCLQTLKHSPIAPVIEEKHIHEYRSPPDESSFTVQYSRQILSPAGEKQNRKTLNGTIFYSLGFSVCA